MKLCKFSVFLFGMFMFLTGCENSIPTTDEITIVEESSLDSIPFTVSADVTSLKLSKVETITISIFTEINDWDYYVETENGKISNKLSASFDYTRSNEDTLVDTITIFFTDKETGKSYKYTIPLIFKKFANEVENFF